VIKTIRNATAEEWDSIVNTVDTALYFQTREWFEIWASYAGFASDTKLIIFENGKQVLLPYAHIKLLKGAVKAHFLSPKGIGGFVARDKLTESETGELFRALPRPLLAHYVFNPFDNITDTASGMGDVDHTQVLHLSKGFSAIYENFSEGHSRAIRKGLRQGITVERVTRKEDWKSYFELYQDTLARWAEKTTNRYSWKLFEIMHGKKTGGIVLWMAKLNGTPLSGALCFYHNSHVAYWHGATSQDSLGILNAAHVLHSHIIHDACAQGYSFYDFMPSGRLPGVVEFKRRFSPERRPILIQMSQAMRVLGSTRKFMHIDYLPRQSHG
jgi:hypothetical protein